MKPTEKPSRPTRPPEPSSASATPAEPLEKKPSSPADASPSGQQPLTSSPPKYGPLIKVKEELFGEVIWEPGVSQEERARRRRAALEKARQTPEYQARRRELEEQDLLLYGATEEERARKLDEIRRSPEYEAARKRFEREDRLLAEFDQRQKAAQKK